MYGGRPVPSRGGRGQAMSVADSRPWLVIRQDANGNRYRVGRYATRAEAQRVAGRLAGANDAPRSSGDAAEPAAPTDPSEAVHSGAARHERAEVQRYLVERLGQESGTHAT